jgi:hypothetical protein
MLSLCSPNSIRHSPNSSLCIASSHLQMHSITLPTPYTLSDSFVEHGTFERSRLCLTCLLGCRFIKLKLSLTSRNGALILGWGRAKMTGRWEIAKWTLQSGGGHHGPSFGVQEWVGMGLLASPTLGPCRGWAWTDPRPIPTRS